ncbi:MAG: FxsA family protein [Pseudolabrys sp.]
MRHAGGNHIERVRVALGHGDFTALQVDSSAGLVLLAGILLLIPGFITDFLAVLLLVPPLRRVAANAFEARATRHDRDAVIDLAPEQWHKVPDPSLPKRRREKDPC